MTIKFSVFFLSVCHTDGQVARDHGYDLPSQKKQSLTAQQGARTPTYISIKLTQLTVLLY